MNAPLRLTVHNERKEKRENAMPLFIGAAGLLIVGFMVGKWAKA